MSQRVGDLEGWSKVADRRFDEIGRRMDKQDDNLQRIWERLDQHRDGQVKTQTLVEVGNRDVSELKASFNAFRETADQRRTNEEQAEKTAVPARWQVWLTGGALLVAVGSLLVTALRGTGH